MTRAIRAPGHVRRIALVAALAGCAAPVAAQAQRFGAESGLYAESYGVTGREARRPATTLRMYASPSFEWMGMEVGTNLLWSTEQRFVAQPMNRYYLNPRWSWGQLHVGDFVPDVSRHTASTARVRGAGFELHPGALRLALMGGRAQDATDLSTFDAAPQRTLLTGLVGLGSRDATFIELSGLRAFDRIEGSDSISAPPQENAVGSVAGGVALFGGRLRLRGDASGSLFSRDTRAGAIDSLGLPGWTRSLFTPRLSSRADYAWSAEARLTGRRANVGVQAEHVGAGFTTLGNPYFPNDRQELRLVGGLRLFSGRLNANGSLGERHDNLAGDKRATTRRTTGTLALAAVTGDWLVSTATVLVNGMVRQPDLARSPLTPDPGIVDSFRLSNVTIAAALAEQLRFAVGGLRQTVTASFTDQQVNDDSPRYGALLDSRAHSIALDWGLTVRDAYTVSLRPAYQRFVGASQSSAFGSMTVGLSRRPQHSPLGLSLASTYTPVGAGSQLRHDAAFSLRLSDRDRVAGAFRLSSLGGVAQAYSERTASLRLTHRW